MTARPKRRLLGLLAAIGLLPAAAGAQEVNLYSSRHYDSDRALYEAFTKESGIRVRLIEKAGKHSVEQNLARTIEVITAAVTPPGG